MTVTLNPAMILYIASFIGVVGAAVKVLADAKKAIQKPLTEVNEKFNHYDDCLGRDKKHLEELDETVGELSGIVSELGEATNLLVSANRTVLLHLKDNNHTGEIDKQVKELDDWLVNRKDYKI